MPFGITLNLLGTEIFDLTLGRVVFVTPEKELLHVSNSSIETQIATSGSEDCDCDECDPGDRLKHEFGFACAPKA